MEEIHFTVGETFSDDVGLWNVIYIYLQDASGEWCWDESKYTFEEAIEKYPLHIYKWVSIGED